MSDTPRSDVAGEERERDCMCDTIPDLDRSRAFDAGMKDSAPYDAISAQYAIGFGSDPVIPSKTAIAVIQDLLNGNGENILDRYDLRALRVALEMPGRSANKEE